MIKNKRTKFGGTTTLGGQEKEEEIAKETVKKYLVKW